MSISAEEKVCYLREAAIVLAKEGFQLDEVHTDRLCILLDGSPLCEVTKSGGVAYRNEDIDEPERIAAKDKVYEIVRITAEYMRQMEMAPFLKADGLEDGYKVLADFNGTVLAGVQSKHGVHFVTWDWAYGHTGVCHGHYFMENYAGAKQDFAIRSGLIQKERLFTPEQMTEIYRCCADSVDGDFFELTGEQEKMIRSVQHQIEECVPDLDERIRQQEEALEQATQEQTMYPEGVGDEADFIRSHWLNRRTTDCVGLIKGYGWLNTVTMEIQYGSNGMPDVGADGMYYNAGHKGSIETMPNTPGLAVWKSGHIGVYIGNGEVIEAMDTRYGVVKTKLQGRGWTHWLEVPGIKYD